MNFKKQLFLGGAIALLTVGLTGCANNTSSNSSNEPMLEVIMIIVFLKSTTTPLESVKVPSSNSCNKMLNTSG